MISDGHSCTHVGLSNVQKGAIGQYAFLAVAMATGKGQLEAYVPAADNEGRDAEVRRHLSRLGGIGIQIKVAFKTWRKPGRHYLEITIGVEQTRVQNDPRLWFLIGYYDVGCLGLHDPVCVVPASVLHMLVRRHIRSRQKTVTFHVSLDPDARDEFSLYRVPLKDLGKRLLEIVDAQKLAPAAHFKAFPADTILVGRRARQRTPKRLRPAA